jgi:hypothetical protein
MEAWPPRTAELIGEGEARLMGGRVTEWETISGLLGTAEQG